MKTITAAGVIPYRYAHGILEFLIVQHAHGHWEFPKGKLDAGETEREAALRELTEETGTTAQLVEQFHETISYVFFDEYTHTHLYKTVHFFIGEVKEGTVTLSKEHLDSCWLSYEQTHASLTHKELKQLFHKAHMYIQEKLGKK